jgi:hypothetical protein
MGRMCKKPNLIFLIKINNLINYCLAIAIIIAIAIAIIIAIAIAMLKEYYQIINIRK